MANIPKGITVFKPHENAPSFVKGTVIINIADLSKWFEENQEFMTTHEKYGSQIKFQLKENDKGLYLDVDTYKKS